MIHVIRGARHLTGVARAFDRDRAGPVLAGDRDVVVVARGSREPADPVVRVSREEVRTLGGRSEHGAHVGDRAVDARVDLVDLRVGLGATIRRATIDDVDVGIGAADEGQGQGEGKRREGDAHGNSPGCGRSLTRHERWGSESELIATSFGGANISSGLHIHQSTLDYSIIIFWLKLACLLILARCKEQLFCNNVVLYAFWGFLSIPRASTPVILSKLNKFSKSRFNSSFCLKKQLYFLFYTSYI